MFDFRLSPNISLLDIANGIFRFQAILRAKTTKTHQRGKRLKKR